MHPIVRLKQIAEAEGELDPGRRINNIWNRLSRRRSDLPTRGELRPWEGMTFAEAWDSLSPAEKAQ
ncbi:MAG: hypothetical protein KatS3mg014_2517 [Actinomycetota bacterium]|nr:MAG: hypothetical protein KatS3mg014_2488 [Actinomycetota bacterium]GIV00902.1 MAG: hypothetical protein KatS3mg014_2517 [Actinomycetota bacterium]